METTGDHRDHRRPPDTSGDHWDPRRPPETSGDHRRPLDVGLLGTSSVPVVSGSLRWCPVVFIGLRVLCRSPWFLVVSGGFRWSLWVSSGLWKSPLTP